MANLIKSLCLTEMTKDSCVEFHTRVNRFIAHATSPALHIGEQAEAYAEAVGSLCAAASEEALAEANTGYLTIVRVINAYANEHPTEVLETFVDDVNGLVDAYTLKGDKLFTEREFTDNLKV